MEGPRSDEVGAFATVLSRFGPGLIPTVEDALRLADQGPICDLARQVETSGRLRELVRLRVDEALAELWPELQHIAASPRH